MQVPASSGCPAPSAKLEVRLLDLPAWPPSPSYPICPSACLHSRGYPVRPSEPNCPHFIKKVPQHAERGSARLTIMPCVVHRAGVHLNKHARWLQMAWLQHLPPAHASQHTSIAAQLQFNHPENTGTMGPFMDPNAIAREMGAMQINPPSGLRQYVLVNSAGLQVCVPSWLHALHSFHWPHNRRHSSS